MNERTAPQRAVPTGIHNFELGEGPVWNPMKSELSMVDIFDRKVHFFDLFDGRLFHSRYFETEGDVGAALPLEDGSFVLCENQGVFLRHPDGTREKVCNLPVPGGEMRANDAKIGPDGYLWMGVMGYEAKEGQGSLWRVSRDGHTQQLLEGLTIPNGLDWWGNELWFVDGPTEQVGRYFFDEAGLTPSEKPFVTNGTPDGLVLDSAGTMWLALWGEGRIDHYSPSGEVVESIEIASPYSTSLVFAGEDLSVIVGTSAKLAMTDDALARYPRSGDLFSYTANVTGREPFQVLR